MEWGSADLTTEHLLYAALEDGMARHVIEWVDADPDAISTQLEEEADKGRPTRADTRISLLP
jgi:ATP-dependent Clp protease ATP-binding subunit ClpC